jgi:adenylate cyclase
MYQRFWLLCIAALFVAGCKPFHKKPKVEQGFIELSQWDFSKYGTLEPEGDWEFYPQQLYAPAAFGKDSTAPPCYVTVPENWNYLVCNGKPLSGQGYGTYRVRLHGMPEELMGIRIPDTYSAYTLWINGELIATNGKVATTAEQEVTELLPLVKTFQGKGENEVVIQVSNFELYKGGMGIAPTFGTPEQVIRKWNIAQSVTIFLTGMVLILMLYHLLIFITTKNDYNSLCFAGLCLFVAARSLTTNERLINFFIPNLPAGIIARIEYASVFGAMTFFLVFVSWLFPKNLPKTITKILAGLGVLQFFFIALAPVQLFTSLLTVYQLFAMAQLIYVLTCIGRAVIKRKPLALPLALAIVASIIAGVNDILYARLMVNTTFLLPLAIPVLLVVQAYFIAYRIGHALSAVQKLSGELNELNQNLEHKVTERTAELNTEKQKTDELLRNILPEQIALELKEKGHADARTYSLVTVMFVKLTGLIRLNKNEEAVDTVNRIGESFSGFDDIIEKHGLEKIKTIGDVYLCASGLPTPTLRHAENAVRAAIDIRNFMRDSNNNNGHQPLEVQVGLHTGPVVAGIVGSKKFAYDIWGDTVNTAARLQQHSEPGMINISGGMQNLLKAKFNYTYRGKIEAKNKGMIDMYYIDN